MTTAHSKNRIMGNDTARRNGAFARMLMLLCAMFLCCACQTTEEAVVQPEQAEEPVTELSFLGQPMPDLAALAEQKELTYIDLRGHAVEIEEIKALQQALPNCEILYSIALGGNTYACTAETLRTEALTAEELPLLDYFQNLTVLDARGSDCSEALEAYAKAHPEITVRWSIPIGTVDVDHDTAWLDLSFAALPDTETLMAQLGRLNKLTDVSLVGCELSLEDKLLLKNTFPDLRFYWTIDLDGKQFKNTETRLDFNGVNFDGADHLALAVACFQDPQWVDVATHGFESAEMVELCEQFPETEFVWTVRVGSHTVRTDIEVFYGRSGSGARLLRNDDIEALQYCKKLRAVNLYRNSLSDLSPLAGLTELEVLILSNNKISDLSPLKNLKNLQYLEAHNNYIEDISPLANLTQLRDLNLMFNDIQDFAPIQSLSELQRGYFPRNEGLENGAWQKDLTSALPNAALDFDDSNTRGWQNHDRYDMLDRIWISMRMEPLY